MSSDLVPLNSQNLSLIQGKVRVPTYDRSSIKTGIVHVGIGGFHRSHQAYYTDLLMENHGIKDWGICGVALLKYDKKIYDTLVAQNGLYTLMITEPDGKLFSSVIGSIVEYLYAPDNIDAVIEKMAHPDIKIITLTITEGGYKMNSATGEFQMDDAAVQKDLQNPSSPETIFGYVTQALKRRQARNLPGLTIQSCDNIQCNGEVSKSMFLSYMQVAEPGLLAWVETNVRFPNAMVDRITPVTTPTDIQLLADQYHLQDAWPVVCEPFCQWVIEDDFAQGRPAWDLIAGGGVQFVKDVHPYEKMKIRMLNGSHTALAMTGILVGYSFVYEAMKDPLLLTFLNDFMEQEVKPILDPVPGIDLDDYRSILLGRFANPNIKDQLSRIASETSAKAPKFFIATINDHFTAAVGGEDTEATAQKVKRCVVIVAAWCQYIALSVGGGGGESTAAGYLIQDAMKDVLLAKALQSLQVDQEAAFLDIPEIFGNNIREEKASFVALYVKILRLIRKDGMAYVLSHLAEL